MALNYDILNDMKSSGSAICLFSGGIDSTTALYRAKKRYKKIIALSFDYGQRHRIELVSARKIALLAGVEHRIMKLDFSRMKSALTDKSMKVPSDRNFQKKEIPVTWVPQRNTIFLACGFAIAELEGCDAVVAGMNAVDYSGYPDCRSEFLKAFEEAANLASKRFVEKGVKIKIVAPFVRMKKSEIIKRGLKLGVPYEHTWSCYMGKKPACGVCDSCRFRLKAFEDAGVNDPLDYSK